MSSSADRVEVFAGIQRRRRYSVDQKLAVLEEAARPGMTISYVARRHGISPSLLFGWRRRMAEGGKEAVRADDEVVAKAELLALQKRVRELERVLGKKTRSTRSSRPLSPMAGTTRQAAGNPGAGCPVVALRRRRGCKS
jgi:transposase